MKKFYLGILCLLFFGSSNAQAQQKPDAHLTNFLRQNLERLQLTNADVDDALISSAYTDPKSNIQYVYLQQAWQNIKVYNSMLTVIIRDDKLLSVAGKFVSNMASKAGLAGPVVPASQAITRSAQYLHLKLPVGLQITEDRFIAEKKLIFSPAGIAKRNIETELFWVPADDNSTVRLAWNVNIDVLHSADWWNIRIDAMTGDFVGKNNWTVYEDMGTRINKNNTRDDQHSLQTTHDGLSSQQKIGAQYKPITPFLPPPGVTNAAYYVVPFPYESPSHHALAVENEPWLKSGAGNPATTDGWQYDGSVDYNLTRGNNVFAYLDVANLNAPNPTTNWPDTSTTPVPILNFIFLPNFNLQPSTVTNKRTALANLFYWNNLMHDVYYQYGFNEVAGNFQTDNLGRGGSGGDYVQAEAQDGGGTNNANFATPVDGQRPRMQMYLWTTGAAIFNVLTPPAIAGSYTAVEGAFSTNNLLINVGPVTGQVIYYNDNSGGLHEGCVPPSNTLTGKIAMIDRANCNFTVKVKNAQDAGAIAVIMVNNVAGAPIIMGGTDNTIIIPAVMISQSDGDIIKAQLGNTVNVTIGAPINVDGDLDNGVVCHEFGHGISNRCTGGPGNTSCLGNAEEGGEGWSDYMALMMVTNWATATVNDGPIPRPVGTYAAGQPTTGSGIRNYPYSTNMAVNPLVYLAVLPAEVHNLGEIWCEVMWEMTWEMIQVDGINPNVFNAAGTGGNSAAMKLLVEGMKLQPCSPGFIDARNAILRADTIFFNAHYSCAIWKAFAKRGMGRNASEGSSNSVTDQVPDFSVGYAALTAQPANTSVCSGTNASFSVTGTGVSLSYQWQVSTNGGGSFANIPGATTSTLTLTAVTLAMNNNQYRCIVGGSCGPSVTSSAGILTISLGPAFTAQPAPQSVCSGNNAVFSVTATGPVTGYQWQVSTNGGGSFTDISGATTSTLTLTAVTLAMNNNQYRCVLSSSCGGGLTSTVALLTVNLAAAITSQPANTAACVGANASFNVTATGATSYQWQLSTNGGGSFADIPGSNTSTLSLTAVTLAMNNNQYRCNVGSGCGPALTSNAAILTVATGPTLTGQPTSQTICAGNNAIFSVTVSGPATGYQWQVSTNGGGSFTDISGATTPTLTLTAVTAALNNNQYRCVISSTCGSGLTSTAATLTVNSSASITTQPSNSAVCIGANASFSVTATGTTGYQWQVSTNGGVSFTDIPGATTSTLTLTAVTAAMNNNQYRCVMTSLCTGATTTAAILTVFAPPTISSQPANTTVCAASNANFTVTAAGPIAGYQWQVSTDGGVTFSNISGATSATLTLTAVTTAQNANRYRCLVVGNCVTVNSNSAVLTVNPLPVFTLGSIPATLCVSDTAITLTATLAGGTWTGTGVQGNKFYPSVAGVGTATVTYTVTNGFGCMFAVSASIQVNACPERHVLLSAANSLIIYPNPNNGNFNIRIHSDLYTKLGLKVYNSDGQLIKTQSFTGLFYNTIFPVDLSKASSGLYHLFFYNNEGGTLMKRAFGIVINH